MSDDDELPEIADLTNEEQTALSVLKLCERIETLIDQQHELFDAHNELLNALNGDAEASSDPDSSPADGVMGEGVSDVPPGFY